MFLKGFTILAAVALSAAAPQYANRGPEQPAPSSPVQEDLEKENLPATYEFHYNILSEGNGDIKSQTEIRDGFDVNGEYSVVQPDGCIRTVRYFANAGGFVPEVSYQGNCDPAYYQVAQQGTGPDGSYKIEFEAPVTQQQHEDFLYNTQQAEAAQSAPDEEGYWVYEQILEADDEQRHEEIFEVSPAQYEAPAAAPERYEDKPETQFEEAAPAAQHEEVYASAVFSSAEPELTYDAPVTTTQAPVTPAPTKVQNYEAPQLVPAYVEPAPLAAPAIEVVAPTYDQEVSVPEAHAVPEQELTYEVHTTTTKTPAAAPISVKPSYEAPRPKQVYAAPALVRPASPPTTTPALVAKPHYAPAPMAAPASAPTYEEEVPVHEAPLQPEYAAPVEATYKAAAVQSTENEYTFQSEVTATTTAPATEESSYTVSNVVPATPATIRTPAPISAPTEERIYNAPAIIPSKPAQSAPAEKTYNSAVLHSTEDEYSFQSEVLTTTAAPVIVPPAEEPSYSVSNVVPAKHAFQPMAAATTPAPTVAPAEEDAYNAPAEISSAHDAPVEATYNSAVLDSTEEEYSIQSDIITTTLSPVVIPAAEEPSYITPSVVPAEPAFQPVATTTTPAPIVAPAEEQTYNAPTGIPSRPAYEAPASQPSKHAKAPASYAPAQPTHSTSDWQPMIPAFNVPASNSASKPGYTASVIPAMTQTTFSAPAVPAMAQSTYTAPAATVAATQTTHSAYANSTSTGATYSAPRAPAYAQTTHSGPAPSGWTHTYRAAGAPALPKPVYNPLVAPAIAHATYNTPKAPAVLKPAHSAPAAPASVAGPVHSVPLLQQSKPMYIAARPQAGSPVYRTPASATPVYRAPVALPAKAAYATPHSQPAKPAYRPAAARTAKPVFATPVNHSGRPVHMVPVPAPAHLSSRPAHYAQRPSAPSKSAAPVTYYRKVFVPRAKHTPLATPVSPVRNSWTAPAAYRPAPAPSAAPRPTYYAQAPSRY